jgi:hypothetical protein
MQLVPAYKLASVSKNIPAEECLSQLPTLQQGNRNFEFYYFPYSPYTQLKMMNPTDDPAEKYGVLNYLSDMVLENYVFQVLSTTSKYIPSLAPAISKLSGALVGSAARKCWSYDAYPTPRLVRFHEMEYNIPIEHFEKVFREVRDCMEKNRFKINFPLECRFVKADDIWLSPCYKRDSAYIAAHAYQGTPFKEYFAALEAIFTQYDGRPHWGKINTADTPYLEKAYPKFHAFLDFFFHLFIKSKLPENPFPTVFSSP